MRRGEFSEAFPALRQAADGQAGWKLRAALFGLRLAPQLMRRLYVAREEERAAS